MARIAIIGAGAAGIAAALCAAGTGNTVFLFDSNGQPGRKLAITGSGRGNLSNMRLTAEKYASDSIQTVRSVFEQFDHEHLVKWLLNLGIPTYTTADGWCYPVSNSAANVVSILTAQAREKSVQLRMDHKVIDILPGFNEFSLTFDQHETMHFSHVVVACGGKASPRLGSRGELFPVLKKLGYDLVPICPALAPVLTDTRPIHTLQGVRMDIDVKLIEKAIFVAEAQGNAIFTEWGINGPAVMDLSHFIRDVDKKEYTFEINFLPTTKEYLVDILSKYRNSSIPIPTLLGSVIPAKVARWSMRMSNLPEDMTADQINEGDRGRLMKCLSQFRLKVKGTKGFDDCQVSTGGVKLEDVFPHSMQSRIHKGLYFVGEMLNVVGPCGGYNLQWAFSSGVIAGKAVGENL